MSKSVNFKETERRISLYYQNIKRIKKLKNRIVTLEEQLKEILIEMKELKNFKMELYLNMGIDYSKQVIKSYANPTNEVEREIYKYIDDLRKKCILTKKRILRAKDKIRGYEYINQDIEFCINSELSEDEKKLLELKYSEKESIEYIAEILFTGARSTTYRKREDIIKKLSKII